MSNATAAPYPYQKHYTIHSDGSVTSIRSGKKLKPGVGPNGYETVVLSAGNGVKKTYAIHRLVHESFTGKKTTGRYTHDASRWQQTKQQPRQLENRFCCLQ